MTLTVNAPQADPKAIAVARAVQNAVQNDAVIVLFGSRARGDYRDNSDLDLMALVPEPGTSPYSTSVGYCIQQTARLLAQQEYGREMSVDVIEFDRRQFHYCRRAINHVACDIDKDGIPMSELPSDLGSAHEGEYRDNWLDTRERIRDTLDSFRSMHHDLNDGAEKYLGRHAQETLEHCYKALIAALGVAYQRTHNLRELEAQLAQLQQRHGVHIPASPEWLSYFSGGAKYQHPPQMPEPPQVFFERVQHVKDAIIARVYELTGTTESDLYSDD